MKSKSSSNNHFKRVSYNRNKVSLKSHTIIPLNGYRIENEETIRCLGYESKEIYQSLVRKKEAKAVLTYAFASEAINNISIPEVKEMAQKLIAKKLNVDLDFNL